MKTGQKIFAEKLDGNWTRACQLDRLLRATEVQCGPIFLEYRLAMLPSDWKDLEFRLN